MGLRRDWRRGQRESNKSGPRSHFINARAFTNKGTRIIYNERDLMPRYSA